MKETKQLTSTNEKNVKQGGNNSVPGSLQNFSPNPRTYPLNFYEGNKQIYFQVYKFI